MEVPKPPPQTPLWKRFQIFLLRLAIFLLLVYPPVMLVIFALAAYFIPTASFYQLLKIAGLLGFYIAFSLDYFLSLERRLYYGFLRRRDNKL
jgi:uncharacterized RDD family membrane protein YckC